MEISVVRTRRARVISASAYKESEREMSSLTSFCSLLLGGKKESYQLGCSEKEQETQSDFSAWEWTQDRLK